MYKIVYSSESVRALRRMPHDTADLIREKLKRVASDLFAPIPNATSLQGRTGYRLRVGDWRVIYEIDKVALAQTGDPEQRDDLHV